MEALEKNAAAQKVGTLGYEFPDFTGPDVAEMVAPELAPTHWHNDVCPSYGAHLDATLEHDVRLWTDYPDKERREMAGAQYTLATTDGNATVEGETWAEFVAALEAATPQCDAGASVGARAMAWARAHVGGKA